MLFRINYVRYPDINYSNKMIGYLTGTIHSKYPDQIILLVCGVGYLVTVPANYNNVYKIASKIELYIYPHIRQDCFDLYGFFTTNELGLYKMMLTVSGVGPKTALMVIDKGVAKVEQAIKEANIDFFTTVPRLGYKNAQKIIIELKNKVGGLKDLDLTESSLENSQAIEALLNLGYSKTEAIRAIEAVPVSEKTLEQKIGYALRSFGKVNLNK